MRKRISVLFISLLLVLMLAITSCSGNLNETNEININETALSFVNDLLDEKYDDAYDNYDFDTTMKKAVNSAILKQAMEQLIQSEGDFIEIADTQEIQQGSYDIIAFICEFEKNYMTLNVVFDQEKKIAGFNYTYAQGYTKDDGSQGEIPSNIEEQEVTVGDGKWALPATLTLPKGEGPFSAVVLVHGSGPQDRDETVGPNKPFRDIAWGLASEGIAVLRYEKRTKEHTEKIMENPTDLTVKEETVDDALFAVELLKNHSSIDKDKIYVLGHSLGGYLIPRIGVQDEDIAGFIIMAGATRHMEDMILEQVEYLSNLDGNVTNEEQNQIDMIKIARDKIKSSDFNESTDAKDLFGIGAKYWLDLKDYEPTEMVKELNRPILVLQGERDYQITMVDFENWKNAIGNQDYATFKSFEKLNHIFMPGEGDPNPNEYYLESNVSQEVIDFISQWVIER